MTVKSYVKLAYRIGLAQQKKGKGNASGWFEDDDEQDEWEELDEDEDDMDADDGDDFEAESIECEVADAGKKKRRKRRRESNRAWRHFVQHAFVSTGYEKGQMDGFIEEEEREVWDEL